MKNQLAIISMVIFSMVGCSKKQLNRLTGGDNVPPSATVACCQGYNNTPGYPSTVPASHQAFCSELNQPDSHGGQGAMIDGTYYEKYTTDCGFHHGHIGDQYYEGIPK